MTLQELKHTFLTELDGQYPKEEINSFFHLLVNHTLHLNKIEVALNPNFDVNNDVAEYFKNALAELKTEKPIQYIIGSTKFYGLPFTVNENTLIPRPETEELVDWIVKDAQKTNLQPTTILDIGTGSGCIAISLAKNLPSAEVYAIDISEKALQVAKQNAKQNGVTVHFIEADILSSDTNLNTTKDLRFDIIVSNPPYIRNLEKVEIKKNVLDYEPHTALFVNDENPLIFYKAIADFAKKNLKKEGKLYLEINQYLGKETISLLQNKGFKNIELRKDLFGNDRMLKAFF
ncbi:MAG: peptide chain release factor N(5)-glutamine methyltransferase [Flavobacteriaceae bacterium]